MNPQQVGRAGELFVAAEIHCRGGYAVTFAGNMPGIDILASDLVDSQRISIQVKTKTTHRHSGAWHARFPRDAEEGPVDPLESSFWIFVDLGVESPSYFIVPRSWMRNDIWQQHTDYLRRYEETRGYARQSDHHGIQTKRVEQWRDRWDVLGIF
jgi:hypothetical protein